MNHMSDMQLHLNILNTALLMRLSSIYIEDLLGETASSAYEITGTYKDLNNWTLTSSEAPLALYEVTYSVHSKI